MNLEELHNELNEFPEDLKYSDARWDEALVVIEAHEAKVAARKKLGAALSVMILVGCAFMVYPFSSVTLSEYSPREMKQENLSTEKDSKENTDESGYDQETLAKNRTVDFTEHNQAAKADISDQRTAFKSNQSDKPSEKSISSQNLEDKNAKSQTLDKVASVNEKDYSESEVYSTVASTEVQGNSNNDLAIETTPENMTAASRENENSSAEVEILDRNGSASAPVPSNSQVPMADNLLLSNQNSEPSLNQSQVSNTGALSSTLKRLNIRNTYLSISLPRKQLSSDKKIVGGDKTFKIYREFLGGKVGVNPLARYGRTDVFGGTNPSLGLFYENSISEKVFWNAGLEYFSISSMYLPVSSEETSYNYGFESNVLTVHTDRAHFISAPVYIGARPFNRIQLKAGGSVNVLLETQNTLEEHHVTNHSSTLLNQSSTKGYRTSLNSIGFTASAAMNYWITERTSLQFTYHYGLTDFSKDEVFGNQTINRNTRFEVSINKVLK